MERLNRWIEAVPGIADDSAGIIRVRGQHAVWLFTVSCGGAYLVGFLLLGMWIPATSISLLLTISTLALFLLTRRGHVILGGKVIAWVFLFNFLGAVGGRGGIDGPAAPWLLLAPLVGGLMVNLRLAIRLTLASITAFFVFWLVENAAGIPLESDLPAHVQPYMPLIDYPTIAIGLLACFWGIQGVFQATNTRLDQQNQDLQREVTQRKAAEAKALEAAQARYTFLATISHEIRTPLNGVLGLAQVLRGTSLDDDQRQLVDTIQSSGGLLRRLLDDVLDYAKVDSGHMELDVVAVDLTALCAQLLSIWKATAQERGVDLSLELSWQGPLWVSLDANKLRQVLGNLLSNAIKFTPAGGTVCLGGALGQGRLQLWVQDSGAGIEPAAQAAVFQAFRQGDGSSTREHGGTGLGLAICRDLTRLMGGELALDSTPGEGSTFSLSLPLERAAPLHRQPVAAPRSLEGLRVLVAEDNPVNQLVIRRTLEELKVEVEVVEDGELAVEHWRTHRPELILMDCQMPRCDGYEATRRIREAGGVVPIIALTANAMPGDRQRSLQAGMDEHLGKPIDRQALHAALLELTAASRATG